MLRERAYSHLSCAREAGERADRGCGVFYVFGGCAEGRRFDDQKVRRQTGINADDRGAAGAPLLVAATPLAVVADHERARLGRAKVGEHQVAGT